MGSMVGERDAKAWTMIVNNHVQRSGSDTWSVKSSDGKKVYTVIRWGDTDLRCNCRGFAHYRRCKHSDAVQKVLDIARRNF